MIPRQFRRAAACLAIPVVAARPARAVEYALTYLAIPGTIDYVETNLGTNVKNPQNDTASFGALGLEVLLPLPASVGPFSTAVATGFVFPAGSQAFDHRRMTTNGGSATHNVKHDQDFSTWEVGAVPLLAAIRYATPAAGVTFGGEVGIGAVLLGISTVTTTAAWDSSDTVVVSRETRRRQDAAIALAVEAAGGLVVPATESLSLNLWGGLMWVSDQPFTTTDDAQSPVLIYGETPDLPGLTVGGLGFMVRLGLALTL